MDSTGLSGGGGKTKKYWKDQALSGSAGSDTSYTGPAPTKKRRPRRNQGVPPTYTEATLNAPTSMRTTGGPAPTGSVMSPTATAAMGNRGYNPNDPGTIFSGAGGEGGYHNQGESGTVGVYPGPFAGKNPAYNQAAARDPFTFWSGELGPGNEGGYGNQFMAQMFNPYNLSVALGRSTNDQDVLNYGNQLAQQFMGQAGMGKFMDPTSVVASLFKNAAGMSQDATGMGGPLAQIAVMAPQDALSMFTQILRGAVGGMIPPDELNGMLGLIQLYGAQYMTQWGNRTMEGLGKGPNIISYIASKLGPNFGMF